MKYVFQKELIMALVIENLIDEECLSNENVPTVPEGMEKNLPK